MPSILSRVAAVRRIRAGGERNVTEGGWLSSGAKLGGHVGTFEGVAQEVGHWICGSRLPLSED